MMKGAITAMAESFARLARFWDRGRRHNWEEGMTTIRLTAAQALVRYLAAQRTLVEGEDLPLFAGIWAIFGHGNVAGMGEALVDCRETLPTFRAP